MPLLFTPLQLGPITAPNRIAVAPMCQYTADDGCASDWHIQHWMSLGMSGAGMVTIEATAVERIGRISHGCLGLYSDANEQAAARTLAAARAVALPGTLFGIQIGHAGRKASSQRPWEGGGALRADEDPWPTIGPSAIPNAEGWHVPRAMTAEDFTRVREAFVATAQRAVRIGFQYIELHFAHGYLMHEVVSPLSNQRTDAFGGSRDKRHAVAVEVLRAVKAAIPDSVAVGARITGSDWVEGGITPDDAVALAAALGEEGLAYACVSSGGISTAQKIPVGSGYQVHLARAVKEGSGVTTRAVGMITGARQAEEILQSGSADLVAIGRGLLDDPRWGWHAAQDLGVDMARPPQFARVHPRLWAGATSVRA
jgi:2,4-dienoyl-CoA reductase-like NADH-dependent reductase (Old Yellow Enzyme family)